MSCSTSSTSDSSTSSSPPLGGSGGGGGGGGGSSRYQGCMAARKDKRTYLSGMAVACASCHETGVIGIPTTGLREGRDVILPCVRCNVPYHTTSRCFSHTSTVLCRDCQPEESKTLPLATIKKKPPMPPSTSLTKIINKHKSPQKGARAAQQAEARKALHQERAASIDQEYTEAIVRTQAALAALGKQQDASSIVKAYQELLGAHVALVAATEEKRGFEAGKSERERLRDVHPLLVGDGAGGEAHALFEDSLSYVEAVAAGKDPLLSTDSSS